MIAGGLLDHIHKDGILKKTFSPKFQSHKFSQSSYTQGEEGQLPCK
jgi:hypothetical protein